MPASAEQAGLERWLSRAAADPAGLPDAGYVALLGADGTALERLCALADALRRERVGEEITFAVNRNLHPELRFRAPERFSELLVEAWALGATEVCIQGPLSPATPRDGALQIVAAVREVLPEIHLHAFRPAEFAAAAERLGLTPQRFLERARDLGLGSVPGTAARILDDAIRARLSEGTDPPVARWVELIEIAHGVGLASTATMVYGHLETPDHQVAHLRTLAAIQDRTGGFSELILMPIQPEQVPPVLAGAVRWADARETRALHAVARLMLSGRIDHLQAPWPKTGLALAAELLAGGADDVGGILLDGTLDPGAGPEAGRSLGLEQLESVAAALGRGLRQRTTLYGDPGPERREALRRGSPAPLP
ncbi:MAG TPA: hypothetical protein VFN48_11425 [Solirubrobacteraceae bacterium]|nr:hypothetical protein [Solirubrobacteraceae bacterium]